MKNAKHRRESLRAAYGCMAIVVIAVVAVAAGLTILVWDVNLPA